jgi:YcaO-like protein with predicted kinase domain
VSAPSEQRIDKRFVAGTHRTRSPRETFDDYKRFMPAMGITRIADVTGLDVIGLPVFTAIRPNARFLSTSQGKGVDADSARASALMEAIELWHAEHIDEARLRWDTWARLRRSAPTLDLDQVATRGPIAIDAPMLWIEGRCLFTRAPTWVPFGLVSLGDMPVGGVPTSPLAPSTTGLASGNHVLEATAHALCEIIERHCEVAWVSEGGDRVDPNSVSQGIAASVLASMREAGVYTCIWDCTSPTIGVPTYACEVMDPPDAGRRRLLGSYNGSGSHLSAEVALARAITEAAQSRLTYIAGSRDDILRAGYASSHNATIHDLKWRDLRAATELKRFDPTSLATATFGEDIERLLLSVERIGVKQAIVVDLTRRDVGVPVVKAIVPGMTELGAPHSEAQA